MGKVKTKKKHRDSSYMWVNPIDPRRKTTIKTQQRIDQHAQDIARLNRMAKMEYENYLKGIT